MFIKYSNIQLNIETIINNESQEILYSFFMVLPDVQWTGRL